MPENGYDKLLHYILKTSPISGLHALSSSTIYNRRLTPFPGTKNPSSALLETETSPYFTRFSRT
jgi:hypothetical protein